MGRWAAVLAGVVALAAATPATARAQEPAAPQAEWTFMVYMDADCNLELPTLLDLLEMGQAGSTPQVNVVVLVDRARSDDMDDGYSGHDVGNLKSWTSAKLLYVERERFRQLADWGEVDMSDGAVLRRFVETVRKDFPAQRYALVIGDHGAAWPGVVSDDSSPTEGDLLTIDELKAVLTPALAGQPLDLLGFDACLMANYETALTLAPVAKVLVASEELEPGTGWEYTTVLRGLAARPASSGLELGRSIADAYYASYARSAEDAMRAQAAAVTLSVIALDKMAPLESAVGALGEQLAKSLAGGARAAWLKVAEARSRTEKYGTLGDPDAPEADLHDLADFAKNLARQVSDPATRSAAAAVERAVGEAVAHRVRGRGRPEANGLSIFLPGDAETLAAPQPVAYPELAVAGRSRWLPFLKAYAGISDADQERPEADELGTTGREVSAEHPVRLATTVRADDVDEAFFVLHEAQGEDSYVIGQLLTEPDEKGRLEDEWDGDWFTIGVGNRRVVAPITDMEPADDEEEEADAGDDETAYEEAAEDGQAGDDQAVEDDEAADDEELEDTGHGVAQVGIVGTTTRGDAAGTRRSADDEEEADAEENPENGWWFIEVPAELGRKGGSTWTDVWLYFLADFDADTIKGEFVYAFAEDDDGAREVTLRAGDRIRPVYVHYDAEGEEDLVVSEAPEDVLTLGRGGRDLDVRMSRVEPGDYRVGFMVFDYSGNLTEDLVEVTVR